MHKINCVNNEKIIFAYEMVNRLPENIRENLPSLTKPFTVCHQDPYIKEVPFFFLTPSTDEHDTKTINSNEIDQLQRATASLLNYTNNNEFFFQKTLKMHVVKLRNVYKYHGNVHIYKR